MDRRGRSAFAPAYFLSFTREPLDLALHVLPPVGVDGVARRRRGGRALFLGLRRNSHCAFDAPRDRRWRRTPRFHFVPRGRCLRASRRRSIGRQPQHRARGHALDVAALEDRTHRLVRGCAKADLDALQRGEKEDRIVTPPANAADRTAAKMTLAHFPTGETRRLFIELGLGIEESKPALRLVEPVGALAGLDGGKELRAGRSAVRGAAPKKQHGRRQTAWATFVADD